jgi:hypothetical protein
MTNVGNRQTCTIGYLNLVLAAVALVDMEALEIIGKMISSPGVK